MDKATFKKLYPNAKQKHSDDKIQEISDITQEVIRVMLNSQHFHNEDVAVLSECYTRLRTVKKI